MQVGDFEVLPVVDPIAAPHFPGMKFGRFLKAEGRLSFVFD